jgi:hypothetical protein
MTKSIPTAWVLAGASLMVSVGVVAWIARPSPTPAENTPERRVEPARVAIETSTPERAAETFLDAWRKRAHEDGMAISEADAYERIRARRDSELALDPADRAQADALWRRLADMRLHFEAIESERLAGGMLRLRGIAKGMWLGKPYERPVEYELVERPVGWRVTKFELGAASETDAIEIPQ